MTPYEQLKKVIQAANPEIMELKFGCEVKVKIGVFISKLGREDNILKFTVCAVKDEGILVTSAYDPNRIIKKEDIVKILGRPIRLADVLLAVGKDFKAEPRKDELMIYFYGSRLEKLYWNLKDDNLDHQSEECKQFLIKLLTTKK